MPKKVGGLNQKQAVIVFVVVAVGVFFYLRHRGSQAAAQSVSAPAADQTASGYPQQAQDATGGASSSAGDPYAALLNQFATTPPYYYYNTGNNSTTTTTNNYQAPASSGGNGGGAGGGGGGGSTTVTAPVSSGGDPFKPIYNVPKATTTYADPGFLSGTVGPAQPIKGPTIFAFK